MQFELFFPCLYNHPSATSSTFPAACVSVHFLYSCPPLPLSLPLFLSLSLSSSSPTVVDGLLTVLCSGRRLLLSVQPFLGPIGSRCVAGTQRQQPFMERENVCVCMWDNLWQRCDISSSQCALELFLTRVWLRGTCIFLPMWQHQMRSGTIFWRMDTHETRTKTFVNTQKMYNNHETELVANC